MLHEGDSWPKSDETDERLVNPTAYLIQNFRHYPQDKRPPYQKKAKIIERTHPELVQSLLSLQDQLDKINAIGRIFSDNPPTAAEVAQYQQLVRTRLQQVKQFVVNTYGSVDAFIDWWNK